MIILNETEVEFNSFPNGETQLLHDELDIRMFNNIFFKYENDGDLIKLMFLKKFMNGQCRNKDWNRLVISYMPYSRMDRSEDGSPFTLKYVTEFINSLDFSEVIIIEPHSDVTLALLDFAKAKYVNFNLVPDVMENMEFDIEKDYIFFPDAGAAKRYHSLKGYKTLVGHKERDFKTGEIKSLKVVGDVDSIPGGAKVLIIDDLSSYGGTFVHSAIALYELGFSTVNLLVAHAENSIFKGKLFDNVDKVYTTDSILTARLWADSYVDAGQLKIYKLKQWDDVE